MTAKKDLKRRVRARAARTGESYVTARRRVTTTPADPPFPVVEMVDATAAAAALGLACKVSLYPPLAQRVDIARALTRLRDALRATGADAALDLMRDVVFEARRPARVVAMENLAESRRYVARLRAGIGGVSPRGRMLALDVDGELVVFALWQATSVIVTTVDGLVIADPISGLAEARP